MATAASRPAPTPRAPGALGAAGPPSAAVAGPMLPDRPQQRPSPARASRRHTASSSQSARPSTGSLPPLSARGGPMRRVPPQPLSARTPGDLVFESSLMMPTNAALGKYTDEVKKRLAQAAAGRRGWSRVRARAHSLTKERHQAIRAKTVAVDTFQALFASTHAIHTFNEDAWDALLESLPVGSQSVRPQRRRRCGTV